jgi:membrane-associated phospholipid phosphatase
MESNQAFAQFLRGYFLIFALGLILCLLSEKGTFVWWLAHNRSPLLDYFFRYWTFLGDGIMVGIVGIMAAAVRYRYALILFAIGIAQLVASYFFKKIVFGNLPRPRRYFQDVDLSLFVPNVEVYSNHTFPSGHTITAFGLCFFIALMCDRPWVTRLSLLIAVSIGFSRIYLFQHFLEDVVAGSLLGVAVTGGLFFLFAQWRSFWEDQKFQRSMLGNRIQDFLLRI